MRVDRVLGLDAHPLGAGALLVAAEPQPALELAADALERGRRDHALGRAAGAEQDVDAGVGVRGHHRAGDVAVADQADARAGLADLGDQLVVAVAIEDHRGAVLDAACPWPSRCAARFQVGDSRRSITPRASGPTAIFCMYVSGALRNWPSSAIAITLIASGAPVAHRFVPSSGSTAMSTFGESASSVVPAGADLLADEQHRRLVALALADHDGAADVDRVERDAHRLDRDVVGELAIAAAHEARRRERGGLGDADDFEREVAVLHGAVCTAESARSRARRAASRITSRSASRQRARPAVGADHGVAGVALGEQLVAAPDRVREPQRRAAQLADVDVDVEQVLVARRPLVVAVRLDHRQRDAPRLEVLVAPAERAPVRRRARSRRSAGSSRSRRRPSGRCRRR